MGFVAKLLMFPFYGRQKRLASKRPSLSEEEFVRRCSETSEDQPAASYVFRHLLEHTLHTAFTPYPDDCLEKVFGIAEEELDEDLILALLRDQQVPPPTDEDVRKFGPVRTPADVVAFVRFARDVS
ncbi:MAG: hypothetical protein AAFR11_06725 [Pseudomonadota bacterium]